MVCPREEAEEIEEKEDKKRITIEWLEDVNGYSYAEGAIVSIGDEKILELKPFASLDEPTLHEDYPSDEVFLRILGKLGYEVDFIFPEDE